MSVIGLLTRIVGRNLRIFRVQGFTQKPCFGGAFFIEYKIDSPQSNYLTFPNSYLKMPHHGNYCRDMGFGRST